MAVRIVLEGRAPFMDLAIQTTGRSRTRTEVDAAGLTYVCPLELVGIPVLLADALRQGRDARLVLPDDPNISSYLQRMDVVQHLVERGVTVVGGTPEGPRQNLETSLLEVTPLADPDAVEAWNGRLFKLVKHQSSTVAANQVFHIVGEVLDNAISHGHGPTGAFAVAQYYSGKTSGRPPHIEVAIADGGRGILDHLRTVHDEVETAEQAIQLSLREGVSGIADSSRGRGLDEVDRVGQRLGGRILIRSTDGVGRIEFTGNRPLPSFFTAPQSLPGTWMHIELHLPQGATFGADVPDVVSLNQ